MLLLHKQRLLMKTHAKTLNKQDKVLKSKYPKYSLSKGTIIDVINAKTNAINITIFFLQNVKMAPLGLLCLRETNAFSINFSSFLKIKTRKIYSFFELLRFFS